MEIVQFIYNEQSVDFEPTAQDNVMVNATQMAKVFRREMKDFNKLDSTKNFIEACLISEDSSLIGIKKREDLILSKQNSGTWMHRILALKFAAWLDPMFDVWIFATIERIINHYYREQRDAMIEKITVKARKEEKKQELLLKYPEMAEYFELDEQEKQANSKRMVAIREQFKQLKIEFKPAVLEN